MRTQGQQNGKPDDSGDLSGALELVNRAIEEVRGEVEREKRKLSCIGDEPYDPSESTSFSSSNRFKKKTPPSHLAYDPGSYQMTSEGYTPTPGSSKYTLDSDTSRNNSNSMEYVPTLVKKPRTQGHQQPSPPRSPKYSNRVSSSKCKYTVDSSRPSTDMEYDPLSNYSAGIASKNKKEKDGLVRMEGSKTYKLPGSDMSDEDCVSREEKPPHQRVDFKKYTVSESDGESSGTEYRPTSLSNLQQRKASSASIWELGSERGEKTAIMPDSLTQRSKEEVGWHADAQEGLKRKDGLDKKKMDSQRSHKKSGKSDKMHKPAKELCKKSASNNGSSSNKEKQHYSKKENKSHVKRDDRKNTDKVRTPDKGQTEGSDKKRSDFKIKTVVKVKTDPSKQDKHIENGARESKKAKISDKEISKNKDCHYKNGKLESNKREMDVKTISKSNKSINKSASTNSKDKSKQTLSSANGKSLEEKRPSVSLSHAELFGDESPEEAEPFDVNDEEPEETLVRKSADAFRRGRPNKRKASEMTPLSCDEEEGSRVSKDTVASLGMDFSCLQDDLDFESDPMEECLRIFNESTDVKREDKGRQAKQVEQFFPFILSYFCSTRF